MKRGTGETERGECLQEVMRRVMIIYLFFNEKRSYKSQRDGLDTSYSDELQ